MKICWYLMGLFLFSGPTFAAELSLELIPESVMVGRYTAFCGVVEIKNPGSQTVEFGCPSPASGSLGFLISYAGKTVDFFHKDPLRPNRRAAVLNAGESLYVPFLIMVTSDCAFVFSETGSYTISAHAIHKKSEKGEVYFVESAPVEVDVYEWSLEDEWKVDAWGCAPLLAFGIELTTREIESYLTFKPVAVMVPYIWGGGRMLQNLWRNDSAGLMRIYDASDLGQRDRTISTQMWDYFLSVGKHIEEIPPYRNGDFVVAF
jgi:hypothetical protein